MEPTCFAFLASLMLTLLSLLPLLPTLTLFTLLILLTRHRLLSLLKHCAHSGICTYESFSDILLLVYSAEVAFGLWSKRGMGDTP